MAIFPGTEYADTLYGTGGADTINGLGGDDTLKGFGGADILDGGAGIDTVFYSDSRSGVTVNLATGRGSFGDTLISIENVYASAHQDFLTGDGGSNELHGLQGDDVLEGAGGNDALYGEDGNDNLNGGGGADVLNGGAGEDVANYNSSAQGVFVSLITGTAAFGDAEGDTLSSIEDVIGSDHTDNLWGDDGINDLNGMGGNDTLKGFGGNDFLEGGDGADQLFGMNGTDFLFGDGGADTLDGGPDSDLLKGGGGDDVLRGGIGNDAYIVDSAADLVVEARGEGADTVATSVTYVLPAGSEVEFLETVQFDATTALDLVGNEFDNLITGNNGSNTVVGSPANDGGGYDGLDTMTGLGGGDVFVWTSTAESGVAGNEADVITDFNRAEGDLIAVNLIDADVTVAGNQAFTFTGTGPFTAPGQISFFTTATDTFILFNTDGDANQEMTIRLAGVHAVDASWFVL